MSYIVYIRNKCTLSFIKNFIKFIDHVYNLYKFLSIKRRYKFYEF